MYTCLCLLIVTWICHPILWNTFLCTFKYSICFRKLIWQLESITFQFPSSSASASLFLSQFCHGRPTIFGTDLTSYSDNLTVLHTKARKFINSINFPCFYPLLQPVYPSAAVPSRNKHSTARTGAKLFFHTAWSMILAVQRREGVTVKSPYWETCVPTSNGSSVISLT